MFLRFQSFVSSSKKALRLDAPKTALRSLICQRYRKDGKIIRGVANDVTERSSKPGADCCTEMMQLLDTAFAILDYAIT